MHDVLQIICVHRDLESDLQFWDSLTRSLASADGRYLLCVGSSEKAAYVSGHGETVADTPGEELIFESEIARSHFEKEVRSAGKKIIHNFSDAGISCVGVIGTDRGILKSDHSGNLLVRGIESLVALTRSGVVSILFTSGTDVERKVVDLDPLRVAISIKESEELKSYKHKVEIVLLIAHANDSLLGKMNQGIVVDSGSVLDFPNGLPASIHALTYIPKIEIRLLTTANLGKVRGALLSP